jgi:uncharacterized protein YegP (UPF0339 family)
MVGDAWSGLQVMVKFELFSDAVGRYRFRIVAANGHIVAVGAACESKAAAKRAVKLVRLHAGGASIVDSTQSPSS